MDRDLAANEGAENPSPLRACEIDVDFAFLKYANHHGLLLGALQCFNMYAFFTFLRQAKPLCDLADSQVGRLVT